MFKKGFVQIFTLVFVSALVIATIVLAPADSKVKYYTITDLGTLPGYESSDLCNGAFMNNKGDVAFFSFNGYYSEDRAALWTKKTGAQPLPLPTGWANSDPWGINERAQVTGNAGPAGTNCNSAYPVLWEKGTITLLETSGAAPLGIGNDINNRGEIVGKLFSADFSKHDAVVWRNGKIQRYLPSLPGDTFTNALSVNDHCQIVGLSISSDSSSARAVLWDDEEVEKLPGLGGNGFDGAFFIHENGLIVGQATTVDMKTHGVMWDDDGVIDLTPDFGYGMAFCVNSRGEAAIYGSPDGVENNGYIWKDGKLTNVETLIDPASGWEDILWVESINERGQIAGTGLHGGKQRAFLMTPP